MGNLEEEIQAIMTAYQNQELNAEEKNYLLQEIRDIKAAQQCADNEIMFRHIVQACNVAMAVV